MTSILNKKWEILNVSDAPLRTKLLKNRGLEKSAEIEEFLEPEKYGKFHDPYKFEDMEKVFKRIHAAIEKKERVIVFGDYDVDGITSAAILVKTLAKLGANVSYRLPHRVSDGYGLKEKFVREFIKLGVGLVITVDCGISCGAEIELAHKNGIDVIVTDHHAIPASPPKKAFAIIHPLYSGYPFKDLTGAGIAFKLAQALTEDACDFLDLAAMGTVADIGLLTGENRLIVKRGLMRLAKTNFTGLQSLKELAGIKDGEVGTREIGYRIGPRINAAGRIDSPYFALQLLLNEDEEKGKRLARKLEDLNTKRQDMMQKAFCEAGQYFENNKEFILIKEDKDWHVGIIGLIAGKLTEKYGLPSIILQDLGGHLTASARSPEHFNIIEALTLHSKYLTYFGGHAQAAGFEISKKKYGAFKKALEKYAKKKLDGKDLRPVLKIECEIGDYDVNEKTLDLINSMEPFGAGNEAPKFLIKDIEVESIKGVGKNKSHLKISAFKNKHKLDIIAFQFGEYINEIRGHKKIDAVVSLENNTKEGYEGIQVKAVDLQMN